MVSDDFRMHRTGILGSRRHRLWRWPAAEIILWRFFEFRHAAGRAEIIGLIVVLQEMLCRCPVHAHAADRITRDLRLRRVRAATAVAVGAMGVIVVVMVMFHDGTFDMYGKIVMQR